MFYISTADKYKNLLVSSDESATKNTDDEVDAVSSASQPNVASEPQIKMGRLKVLYLQHLVEI